MSLADFCIRRPVFAAVVNLLVIALGLVAMTRLPVRELPDIDASTVTVRTDYAGAAPEIVDAEITERIEAAVAGVAGVRTISSESEQGASVVRVEFVTGRPIDEAANDVRSAVSRIVDALPEDADEPRIFKNDSDADPVLRIAMLSDRMTRAEITDYADRFVVDRLATIDGVASVTVNGPRPAMRIELDPKALAARGLTVSEVTDALRANNIELPSGEVRSVWREFQLRAATRLASPEEFAGIVLKTEGGAPVRLGDVARVERGVDDEQTIVRSDGREAVGLSVLRQSQSNTIAISDAIRAEIEALRPLLPEALEIRVTSDEAVFIRASIEGVGLALVEAGALVVLVIFLFLGSPRATVIPAVTIPVALIGSFLGMYALGYSINILTLFALILAIGIVVDDAIVVLENVERKIEDGVAPLAAAALGTREVFFAVIATSVTLVAVFVPISFLGGQVGRLFVEFGLVLAMAVGFSTLTALTLAPPLCAGLLRKGSGGALTRAVNRMSEAMERGYARLLRAALGWPLVVLALAAAVSAAAYWLWTATPRELAPREDRGVFFVSVTAPQGSTAAFTDREAREIEARLAPFAEAGEIASTLTIVGMGGEPQRGFIVARLAPWGERRPAAEIVREAIPAVSGVPGARAFPIQPAGLGLRGSRSPLQIRVLGPDFASVEAWSEALRERLEANPGLRNVEIDFERTQPELRVEIDRAAAADLGVSVLDVAATVQTFFAEREATGFIDRGREYPVILRAAPEARRDADDLAEVFVRSGATGSLIPLSAVTRLRETTAAPQLSRFDRLPAIGLSASLAEGYGMGEAIDAVRAAAAETLPPEGRIAFEGQAKEFIEGGAGAALTILFALVIVYLALAAQFESWIDPAVILLSAPLAVTGALGAIWVTGQSITVYTQIGMLLLLGLMAKNGILIVEFANQLRDRGLSVREAAIEGAARRLRPILMTTFSTVLGAGPLLFSTGAGAEARASIGVVIFGGFAFATLLTLVVTPVLYDLLAGRSRSRGARSEEFAHAVAAAGREVGATGFVTKI